MRPGRIVVLCALALAVAAGAVTPVAAYDFNGVKWPGGVVPYFNAASDQGWAVATAVRAWNESGADVRFVAVPRSRAKLVIEDDSRKVYCSEGHASVGYARDARVVIFPAHGITHACNPYWAVRVVAHELGHVLGLVHEDRYCATMNSVGSMHGGAECKPQILWDWRCRLLEPDDVAGVAAVYGGHPRPPTEPELCPLYPAIGSPTGFTASDDATGNVLTLTFTRPAGPAIPAFVAPPEWKHNASFAVSGPAPACTANPDTPPQPFFRWNVAAGLRQHITFRAPSQRECLEIWAIDELGRPSVPAKILVGPPGR